MSDNKLLKENNTKTNPEEKENIFNNIIPFDTVGLIIGIAFPLCSVAYILIKQYATNFWLGVALLALGTFFASWIVLYYVAWRRRKAKAREIRTAQKGSLTKQLIKCRDCSLKKINSGLEYRKLFTNEDIRLYEESLVSDPNPSKTIALIYTSDLSTTIRRKDVMMNNIKEKGANYYVVYFKNTAGEELSELDKFVDRKLKYLNASECEELNDSMDAELLRITDFEIIVLVDSTRKYVQGFVSIDNVSVNATIVGRSAHDSECRERCNYGKSNQEPLYKMLDDEKARMLFNDIDNLMNGGDLHA